ncbi:hypothetical protein E1258_10515 [Micromonospora sp. KC207]|nr:hypothetical protein E1258_10515 [Micromonospora sp. KC207]
MAPGGWRRGTGIRITKQASLKPTKGRPTVKAARSTAGSASAAREAAEGGSTQPGAAGDAPTKRKAAAKGNTKRKAAAKGKRTARPAREPASDGTAGATGLPMARKVKES